MEINGKAIAQDMYVDLKKRVAKLKEKKITPHMAVIFIGHDEGSKVYIAQKQKWADYIGAKITVYYLPEESSLDTLTKQIQQLNDDPSIHGIIIQRPLPKHIDTRIIAELVSPRKDIDGFHPRSAYNVPVSLAVLKLLDEVYKNKKPSTKTFHEWLKDASVVTIGKGETAGKPVINFLQKLGIEPSIIDSKTTNVPQIISQADVIISSVGKKLLEKSMLKKNVVLVGVGLYKNENGKLQGDYDKKDIQSVTSFYTPTPGGVGPVNVAFLLDNLVTAAEKLAL